MTILLENKHTEFIVPTAPFSFRGTFFKPSHFPTPNLSYDNDTYWQTLRLKGKYYGLKILNCGSVKEPIIKVTIFFDKQNDTPEFSAIVEEISYRFDLAANIRSFIQEYSTDPILGDAISRWPGMRVSTSYSLYEFLVITTVLQNTNVRRSVQMINNLFNAYGEEICFDNKKLYGFWDASELAVESEEVLKKLKVGYRAKTLVRQARDSKELKVHQLRSISDKKELRQKLLRIYGVGPATVQYILFEVFHYYDACEHIPPWEQKIYSRLLFDSPLVETEVLLNEINRRWGRWKMLAMHYIFEDLFWKRTHESIPWLEELIQL